MSSQKFHIGVDFDNTLIDYSDVFSKVAKEKGWIGDGSYTKKEVRDQIKQLSDGHYKWQVLQSLVYGSFIHQAKVMDGAKEFLTFCNRQGIEVSIISHKTEFADLDKTKKLRESARRWLKENGFFQTEGIGILEKNVYFHATRDEKIKRISEVGCTHFVDDLEEVLTDPAFPNNVQRILYTYGLSAPIHFPYISCLTWKYIHNAIFK